MSSSAPSVEPRDPRASPAAELLGISDFARRSGVSASTLRAWEERVGFPEPLRTGGGQRRYRASDVELVAQVQHHRERGHTLVDAVDLVRSAGTVGEGSLFALLRRDHPDVDVVTVSARTMLALTWAIEDECLVQASRPLVVGCFQDEQSYVASGRRWRELARSAHSATVFADFAASDPDASPARVALPPGSPMLNEWSLVCVDAQLSVVLVGWERPRHRADDPRLFEAMLSMDRDVVTSAVRHCRALARPGRRWPETSGAPASAATAEARAMSLLRRFAVYADECRA